MTTQRLGIIMNGVTGRMGMNQHLIRSIIAIRDQGGVVLSNGDRVMPDPILVGRNADKVEGLAKQFNVQRWTIDLDEALANPEDTIFFDAAHHAGAAVAADQGDQRRQACLLREADRDQSAGSHRRPASSPTKKASRTASCRTSCSCRA